MEIRLQIYGFGARTGGVHSGAANIRKFNKLRHAKRL